MKNRTSCIHHSPFTLYVVRLVYFYPCQSRSFGLCFSAHTHICFEYDSANGFSPLFFRLCSDWVFKIHFTFHFQANRWFIWHSCPRFYIPPELQKNDISVCIKLCNLQPHIFAMHLMWHHSKMFSPFNIEMKRDASCTTEFANKNPTHKVCK